MSFIIPSSYARNFSMISLHKLLPHSTLPPTGPAPRGTESGPLATFSLMTLLAQLQPEVSPTSLRRGRCRKRLRYPGQHPGTGTGGGAMQAGVREGGRRPRGAGGGEVAELRGGASVLRNEAGVTLAPGSQPSTGRLHRAALGIVRPAGSPSVTPLRLWSPSVRFPCCQLAHRQGWLLRGWGTHLLLVAFLEALEGSSGVFGPEIRAPSRWSPGQLLRGPCRPPS